MLNASLLDCLPDHSNQGIQPPMPVLRVVILWHQHQPYYKDLVTGEYRLPWVRLHALKDYYGMVKLLDEFPGVHQTFNLVPSLITQIQDYANGSAQDPFFRVASRPANDLTPEERRFALQYLFQANPDHLIRRYPRYAELWDRFQGSGASAEKAERYFQPQDFTDLQEKVFGFRPRGVWPSEGSVSEEVLGIAASLGVNWMATDEGVLSRTLGMSFMRDGHGRLPDASAEKLYTIHRYENAQTRMHLIFRDHAISDFIGFVYSGMPAQEAAAHLVQNIKDSAQVLTSRGRDAVMPIILDGENAWEYYPESGREFLRRFYDALQNDHSIEALTVSEAIARQRDVNILHSLTPGSWITRISMSGSVRRKITSPGTIFSMPATSMSRHRN